MTEPTPPLDEELSALLDHQSAPHVAAMVESDPAAKARLAELTRVRDALRNTAVTPLEDQVVDRLVATALDSALDQVVQGAPTAQHKQSDPDVESGAGLGPDSLPDDQRSSDQATSIGDRRPAKRQPPTWLVAAGIVALVGIGLGLVWSGTRDSQKTQFSAVGASISSDALDQAKPGSAADSGAAPDKASDGAPASTTMGSNAESTTGTNAPGVLIDLGTFATTDELRVGLKDSFPTSPALSPTVSGSFDSTTGHRCSDQAKALFSLDTEPSARGAAIVAGKRVVVFEFAYTTDEGRATTLIVATTTETCDPVLTFQR